MPAVPSKSGSSALRKLGKMMRAFKTIWAAKTNRELKRYAVPKAGFSETRLTLRAAGDSKITDLCPPSAASADLRSCEVFVHVPKGANVHRIDGHAVVAAPVVGVLFVGGAVCDLELGRSG